MLKPLLILNFLFLSTAWAASDCIKDYRLQQKFQAHHLSPDQLVLLESRITQGDPVEGWKLMSGSNRAMTDG